jgi:hypothetical protein
MSAITMSSNRADNSATYELLDVYFKELILLQAGYMTQVVENAKNATNQHLDTFLIN